MSEAEWQTRKERIDARLTENQVFDRVAKGFYTAACLRCEKGEESIVGLALPDTALFRKYANRLSRSGKPLRISLFWVQPDSTVIEEQL